MSWFKRLFRSGSSVGDGAPALRDTPIAALGNDRTTEVNEDVELQYHPPNYGEMAELPTSGDGKDRSLKRLDEILLQDPNYWNRQQATWYVKAIGGDRAVDILLRTYLSDDSQAGNEAGTQLTKMGGRRAIRGLAAIALDEAAPSNKRSIAISLIERIAGDDAVTSLRTIQNGSQELEKLASSSLGRLGHKKPRPSCAKCGRLSEDVDDFGAIVDQCSSCGKTVCRSCKILQSYHQLCPMCGGNSWSQL